MPIHTSTCAPVSGCVTNSPVGIPFFSIVARSASITLPCLHSSTNAASFASRFAAAAASGCSAATAQKVTPMIVSARVVNTRIRFFSPSSSYGKPKFTPSLRPIQFACISFTRSGQPGSVSSAASSSSAYWVMRR